MNKVEEPKASISAIVTKYGRTFIGMFAESTSKELLYLSDTFEVHQTVNASVHLVEISAITDKRAISIPISDILMFIELPQIKPEVVEAYKEKVPFTS